MLVFVFFFFIMIFVFFFFYVVFFLFIGICGWDMHVICAFKYKLKKKSILYFYFLNFLNFCNANII
jgi:hypothetical protein